MEGFNYHHLLYFRVVAREGSIARASEKLQVSQPTISEQVRTLEEETGTALFTRQGRRLALTDAGRTALRYAEEIHSLGDELLGALREQPRPRQQKLSLGLAEGVPPELAAKVVGTFAGAATHCSLKGGNARELLEKVMTGELDMLLTDSAPLARPPVTVHTIATLPVIIAAAPQLAHKHKTRFPNSLSDALLLMPDSGTRLGRLVEDWLEKKKIATTVAAEGSDLSVLEALARDGRALLAHAGNPPRGLVEIGKLAGAKLEVSLVANARASVHVKAIRRPSAASHASFLALRAFRKHSQP